MVEVRLNREQGGGWSALRSVPYLDLGDSGRGARVIVLDGTGKMPPPRCTSQQEVLKA